MNLQKKLFFLTIIIIILVNGVCSKAYRNINVINKSTTFSSSNKIVIIAVN